jgi:hypothetical protein
MRITLLVRDKPGIVKTTAEVIKSFEVFNIALSETLTINAGQNHYLDLFLEPHLNIASGRIKSLVRNLTKESTKRLGGDVACVPLTSDVQHLPLIHRPVEFGWFLDATVSDGWIGASEWRKKLADEVGFYEMVDLNSVIVSSETARRVLRYTFPKHGAMTFVITGRDVPGAMWAITSELSAAKLSIHRLSSGARC